LESTVIGTPKRLSTRDRIADACAFLVRTGEPITRRAIAEIADCDIRTVSMYKELWSDYAPAYVNLSGWVRTERKEAFVDAVSRITDEILAGAEDKASLVSALLWFRDLARDEDEQKVIQIAFVQVGLSM
jgi:hypothetical protein